MASQEGANIGAPLPFSDLEELNFGHEISRVKISSISLSTHKPRAAYGLNAIRNYLAGHTKKSLRLRVKHLSDLKPFVELPVELQLLVLEHLHPIDLYYFSRVSRYFRQLVLDPAVLAPVWKAAFMRHPDLPTPPPGVKEPEWAFMIYGPGICGVCGKYGALTDFSFQKRFCKPCLNTHTLPRRDFRDESNRQISSRHVIWSLIPFINRHDTRYIARFLKKDFSIMWKKLQLIRILCVNGLSLLTPLHANYISARKDYIKKLMDSARKSDNWVDRIYRQIGDEDKRLDCRLVAKCKTRLQALGHDEQDIDSASYSIRHLFHEKAIYRLTRRAFREIRPRIEILLMDRRTERIKKERRRLLLNIYQDYLKSRSPDEWTYLPDVKAPSILGTKLFKRFLERPVDENVNITPVDVVPLFPEFIEEWIKARREDFAYMLPKNPNETLEARVQRLELVTSVMVCRTCADSSSSLALVVGWKSICRHQFSSRCRRFKISHSAVDPATSLVSCLGLDPLTTTADDMDRRNDRFMCGNCGPVVHRGRPSRKVYTWLECLEHAMASGYSKPVWLPLSPAAARFVLASEKPFPGASMALWRCNHCAHHFEEQVTRVDAIDHVKKVHCIKIPVTGVDVVADPRTPFPKRREIFRLSLDPAYDHHICKHCSGFKLWKKDILIKHLTKMHHVPEPAEHVDWETVPIVAPPAASVPA